ncbi:MAG: lysophospholipid acyltransferase family protein [Desulfurivibrio sp.]
MKLNRLAANLYCWTIFVVATLVFGALLPLLTVAQLLLPGRSPGRILRLAIRRYGWILLRLCYPFIPVTVENRAGELPLPAIFVANHRSALDPYLFGVLEVENAFITGWPFNIPIYGRVMRTAGYIDARGGWPEVAARGEHLMASGCSLIIWPEGHRSRSGKMGRFRQGAFRLAAATGRPLVPVAIIGAGEVLPPGANMLNPGPIKLIILPPIALKKEHDGVIVPRLLAAEARKAITKVLASAH